MMFPKPTRAQSRALKRDRRLADIEHERAEKAAVRRRDKWCRFPLCGCAAAGISLEVAHLEHKGAGGNPGGARSHQSNLILLCRDRHQDSAVSLHRGTLQCVPLDPKRGTNGPVKWLVNQQCVAVERGLGHWDAASLDLDTLLELKKHDR